MDYGPSDSSGTDDDLPSHQTRVQRTGRVTGNGRSAVAGSVPYHWSSNDMEAQIHHLEQEAYCALLRAFKAQSDAITWEKESLITELRKELRVSNEEHRELLGRVNADEVIMRIREWRQAGGLQSQASHDLIPNPTFSASRKKQKISQPIPLVSLSVPSFALHPQTLAASMQPPLLSTRRGGKKTKPGQLLPGISSVKSLQFLSTGPTGRTQLANNDPLIGRKVMTRWPEDNSFYEAVITDYDPLAGLHALVYDKGSANETWEWVNLKEISPEDIRWDGEDVGISHQGGRGGLGNGHRKSIGRGGVVPGAGRGRGAKGQPKKDFPPSKDDIGKRLPDEIEMHQTDTLIKEVERVFGANNPDPIEVERAKKLLKDHEQTLIDAISRLADASDGESEGDRQGQSAEIWKKQQNDGNPESTNIEDSMAREDRGDGSDGIQMVREGGVAADDHQQEGENNNN